MYRILRWTPAFALILGVTAAPQQCRAQAGDAQANIARAQRTLDEIARLLDSIERRRAEGGGAATTRAAEATQPRTYTVVLRGSI